MNLYLTEPSVTQDEAIEFILAGETEHIVREPLTFLESLMLMCDDYSLGKLIKNRKKEIKFKIENLIKAYEGVKHIGSLSPFAHKEMLRHCDMAEMNYLMENCPKPLQKKLLKVRSKLWEVCLASPQLLDWESLKICCESNKDRFAFEIKRRIAKYGKGKL